MSGDPDGDDALRKQKRLADRAARFNNVLPGNRYKELEALRVKQREAFLSQGLITSGKTQLDAAVDLRGTCEGMCSEHEIEFREHTREIHPFEATPTKRIDHAKAVAAYSRSDAGAGHGDATILPSDLRTPQALVRSLDYLISQILPMQPAQNPNTVNSPPPTARRALGYTAGFIRDRTRAIRKEFAIQSSWGHEEAIACFERIARWHILCLRELQEETGSNTDMHIDSAELGRTFTSLRQHYNDRREESGLDMPCPNEPEFRAYMLIFDLNSKSVAIPTSELPTVILDHPLVQLAWQFKQASQRNFDSQKEGSKLNAELGANLINRFVRLLKQPYVPFLFSCLVEIRLREMRRSTIRALTRAYPRLRQDPIRYNDAGEIIERRMFLMPALDTVLGAEEQELQGSAFDDVIPVSTNPDDESVAVVERFGIEVYRDHGRPLGALINMSARYNDNKDAPFTRRWKLISDKRGDIPYADIVNGRRGVSIDGRGAAAPVTPSAWKPSAVVKPPAQPAFTPKPPAPVPVSNSIGAFANGKSAFGDGAFKSGGGSAFASGGTTKGAFGPSSSSSAVGPSTSAFAPSSGSAFKSAPSSSIGGVSAFASKTPTPTLALPSTATPPSTLAPPATPAPPPGASLFANGTPKKDFPEPSTTPKGPPPPSFFASSLKPRESGSAKPPAKRKPSFGSPDAAAGLSKTPTLPTAPPSAIPSFFPSAPATTITPANTPPSLAVSSPLATAPVKVLSPKASPPRPPPEPPKMTVPRDLMRTAPARLRDKLITEVVDSMIRSAEPRLAQIVNRYESAQQYAESKAQRQHELERFARLTADSILAEHVYAITQEVYEQERRIQELVRRIALDWRAYAAEKGAERAAHQRERDTNYARLKAMGLSRSVAAFRPSNSALGSNLSVTSVASFGPTIQAPDELDIILELNETERNKEKLWENSSFLRVLAEHVSTVVRPTDDDPAPVWETVVLTAEHAGSGVGNEARAWLEDKFLPPMGDQLRHHGVTFRSTVDDVRGDIPGSADTGLVVFEAPLETINTSERALNADDAADRLDAISGRFQQGARYRPALLLITWTDEPLDELVDRLQIVHHISEFDRVELLSLEDADDLDERFVRVIPKLVPTDPRMTQVALHLKDLVARLEPGWDNLLHLAEQVQGQFPGSASLVADIMTYALTPFYRLASAINDAVEDLPVSDQSTYSPPWLPRLVIPSSSRNDAAAVAADISTFLAESALAHVDDLTLVRGPLRQAAAHGRPLPIIPVLAAIAAYIFGSLTIQSVRLDQWLVPPHPAHAAAVLVDKITVSLEADFDAAARGIARSGRETQLAYAAETPLPLTPATTPPPPRKGTKRGIDETTSPPSSAAPAETKAAKSARLLRILADAQATLNKIEKMDRQSLAEYGGASC